MFDGITVHCICKNEERWIWYALMSVINYVDRIIIYDTGSTDKTMQVIESIPAQYHQKIELTNGPNVNSQEFTKLRYTQLQETKTYHFMVLDADEIWNYKSLETVILRIKKQPNKLAVFVHYFEFVNDIYHYYMGHEQIKFPLHNRKEYGWYAIRFIKRVENLYCGNDYGSEGYFISDQELQRFGSSDDYIWCDDIYYYHSRNLLRSSGEEKDKEVMQRIEKRHHAKIGKIPEVYRGIKIEYPEVFKLEHPIYGKLM